MYIGPIYCKSRPIVVKYRDFQRARIRRIGLPMISDLICKRQSSVFCHVARLPASTAAHQALKLQVDLSLNIFPSADWKRRPGRPHGWWVDQLRQDNHSPADLWLQSQPCYGPR